MFKLFRKKEKIKKLKNKELKKFEKLSIIKLKKLINLSIINEEPHYFLSILNILKGKMTKADYEKYEEIMTDAYKEW